MRVPAVAGLGLLVLASFAGTPAVASVGVAIDLTHQRMHVVSSHGSYDWPISSARSGFTTPGGSYAPTRLELMHYSKKYHMSPMPHAIFFRGGYAIHGTYSVGELGRPASHGCVRLSPGHAAALYSMVQAEGARISIGGTPPSSRPFQRERQPRVFSAKRFAPRPLASLDRSQPALRRPAARAFVEAPAVRTRVVRRPIRAYAAAPTYRYRAIYGYTPAYVYAPAPYAAAPYGYVSSQPVIGGPAQPPLVPYYGE